MRKVTTPIWRYNRNRHFQFPETKLNQFKGLGSPESTFGVAISGGGSRAASCAIGYLAALKQTGLLNKVTYISAVSGGAWAAIPFTFLPESFDEDLFLGCSLLPEQITTANLKHETSLSFLKNLDHTNLYLKAVQEWLSLSGDETYSRMIGATFLKPYGLDNITRFFTYNTETLNEALAINNDIVAGDFHLCRKNRPFFIATSTILDHEWYGPAHKFQIEFTPYYSGVRTYHPSNESVGGGYISTYAYDSNSPRSRFSSSAQHYEVKISRMLGTTNEFTLSDMMGCTGAAPQETLDSFLLRGIGFPEFRHWSVVPSRNGSFQDDNEFAHSDGGHLENLGIIPLLARGVKNIVVFVNGKTPFVYNMNEPINSKISTSIKNLFIACEDKRERGVLFDKNIVLAGGVDKYLRIINAFRDRMRPNGSPGEAEAPLIFADTYDVVNNSFYGVKAYSNVKIVWICNTKVAPWESKVRPNIRRRIGAHGLLANFPYYKTFLENPPFLIRLRQEQSGLLGNLCAWTLREGEETIRNHFGL